VTLYAVRPELEREACWPSETITANLNQANPWADRDGAIYTSVPGRAQLWEPCWTPDCAGDFAEGTPPGYRRHGDDWQKERSARGWYLLPVDLTTGCTRVIFVARQTGKYGSDLLSLYDAVTGAQLLHNKITDTVDEIVDGHHASGCADAKIEEFLTRHGFDPADNINSKAIAKAIDAARKDAAAE